MSTGSWQATSVWEEGLEETEESRLVQKDSGYWIQMLFVRDHKSKVAKFGGFYYQEKLESRMFTWNWLSTYFTLSTIKLRPKKICLLTESGPQTARSRPLLGWVGGSYGLSFTSFQLCLLGCGQMIYLFKLLCAITKIMTIIPLQLFWRLSELMLSTEAGTQRVPSKYKPWSRYCYFRVLHF